MILSCGFLGIIWNLSGLLEVDFACYDNFIFNFVNQINQLLHNIFDKFTKHF